METPLNPSGEKTLKVHTCQVLARRNISTMHRYIAGNIRVKTVHLRVTYFSTHSSYPMASRFVTGVRGNAILCRPKRMYFSSFVANKNIRISLSIHFEGSSPRGEFSSLMNKYRLWVPWNCNKSSTFPLTSATSDSTFIQNFIAQSFFKDFVWFHFVNLLLG